MAMTNTTNRGDAMQWLTGAGLQNMSQADVIAALRQIYAGQDPASLYEAPVSSLAEYDPYAGTFVGGQALQARYLTPDFDPNHAGGAYGRYLGVYGPDNQLRDVRFEQGSRSDGYLSDNLEWIGPAVVMGAAALGGGLLGGAAGGGAEIGGSVADSALMGGAAGDTLGAAGAESFMSQAPLADSLVSGAMPGSIAGGGLGSGLGANGVAGAMAAAPTIGYGEAAAQALGGAGSALTGGSAVAQLAGAALGAASSGRTQGGTQTTTKEPWEAAQPWLRQQIATGQGLQQHYQQNPFNQVQQTAYQNTLGDIDRFRQSVAPGLFGLANSLTQPYQRQARPGETMPARASQAPFQAPAGRSYGLLDFNAMNPFKSSGLLGG